MFIYQFVGPIYALTLYNHIHWDGKPSKKDRLGQVVVRKARDTLLLLVLGVALLFPPIFMISMIEY